MKIKPNISILNALLRITCGFTFLAWSTAKMTKRHGSGSYLLVAILAGMKIGEGILRFCPVVAIYDNSQKNMKDETDIVDKGKNMLQSMTKDDNLFQDNY